MAFNEDCKIRWDGARGPVDRLWWISLSSVKFLILKTSFPLLEMDGYVTVIAVNPLIKSTCQISIYPIRIFNLKSSEIIYTALCSGSRRRARRS